MKTRVSGGYLWFWCPGCDDSHVIETEGPRAWTWDGNTELPTVSPSLLVRGHKWDADVPEFFRPNHKVPIGAETTCHSFLRVGKWEFLSDCTHDLVGQTVAMVDLPDYFFGR